MTTTADAYIDKVLSALPPATPRREQIATELRGHIAERTSSGTNIADVLQQLGDPIALAESYLTAVPLVPAGFWVRVAAKLIDAMVVIGVMLALGALVYVSTFAEEILPFIVLVVLIGSSFVFAFYTIIAEARSGQTIGKRLMRIRVVRESGARISVGQSIVRQLPMFLQMYMIDVLFALFTDKKQRAFELLSKTRVVVAMLLACVALQAQTPVPGTAPGQLIDIGGRKLHLHCTGTGTPTVVIEAGASSFAIDFALVQPEVARATRICSYDRAGHGWSDGSPLTTSEKVAADLHALLAAAKEKPPFVLVGASMGGIYARIYQLRHPDAVAGMVFIDPSHEDRLFTMLNGNAIAIAELTPEQLLSTIAKQSVNIPARSPQTGAPFDKLPADLYQQRIALDTRLIAGFPKTMTYEMIVERQEGERAALAVLRQERLKNAQPLGARPVIVLTRGVNTSAAQQEVHRGLAQLSSVSRHAVVEGAGHEIHLFQPAAVIGAITEVVQAVRTGKKL